MQALVLNVIRQAAEADRLALKAWLANVNAGSSRERIEQAEENSIQAGKVLNRAILCWLKSL